jgi:hydroxymethylpyrimidine pyrophosphatase-like HAD family hydrolase
MGLDGHMPIVAVDFDGTIVKPSPHPHLLLDFELQPNVKEVLEWAHQHFYLILWTCRNNQPLNNAINFLNKHQIKFDSINENAPFLDFTTSRKIFAEYYIDDKTGTRINWLQIKNFLINEFLTKINDDKIVQEVIVEVTKC